MIEEIVHQHTKVATIMHSSTCYQQERLTSCRKKIDMKKGV